MFLKKSWDLLGAFFGWLFARVERVFSAVFGSANDRQVEKFKSRVEEIGEREPKYAAMSDDELRGQTDVLRKRLREGETLDDILA